MSSEIKGNAELVKPSKCVGCRECERICTKSAIVLQEVRNGIVSGVS
jgi:NAD-dependent dihydropyrimidine dehydrogenase PreA subunit